jgi:hypothetical protein
MKKIITIAALAFATVAHAETTKFETAKAQAPDTCYYQAECDYMWAKAQAALEESSGMQMRLLTNDRAETYEDRRSGNLMGYATKAPAGPNAYRIEGHFQTNYANDHGATAGMEEVFRGRIQEAKWRYALHFDGLALQAKGYDVQVPQL